MMSLQLLWTCSMHCVYLMVLYWHHCSQQHVGTFWISWRHQGQHQRPRIWSSSWCHRNVYLHACFPLPGLGDTLLCGVWDECQIISTENLRLLTNAGPTESTFSTGMKSSWLTHWGRVTQICVSKLTIIVSDNGLSPGRRQANIWTNDGI